LNGSWTFAMDTAAEWATPSAVTWDRAIEVPFAPETARSGIADTGHYLAVWYRRRLSPPALEAGDRLMLRFGAVDYHATVWLDDI
jgi:beta-galactosidase/beta-glucuronidase